VLVLVLRKPWRPQLIGPLALFRRLRWVDNDSHTSEEATIPNASIVHNTFPQRHQHDLDIASNKNVINANITGHNDVVGFDVLEVRQV